MTANVSVDVSLVTEAVIGALVAHFTPKGIRVGDHEAPLPDGVNDVPGRASAYVKVYRVVAGAPNRDESWTGRNAAMKWVRHQIVAAAQDRKTADRTAAEAIDVLLATTSWLVEDPAAVPAAWTVPIGDRGLRIMRIQDDGQVPIETSGSVQAGGLVGMQVCLI